MKKLLTIVMLVVPVGVMAQSATANGSSSTATTSALGNTQAVTFNSSSPSVITTNANVNSNSTSNIINSGTTTSVVDYQGEYTIKNVPSVSGPPLTTSNDTCMGSTSASANGAGFGFSVGSTWTDDHCKRLKMSRELWNKGMKAASLAMDCMDAGAREALEITGTKCPQSMTVEERRAAFGSQASTVGAAPSLPTPKSVAVTPIAKNTVPNNKQAPAAPQATSVVAIPSPAPASEVVGPAFKTESQSSQQPADVSTNAGSAVKNLASLSTVDSAASSQTAMFKTNY